MSLVKPVNLAKRVRPADARLTVPGYWSGHRLGVTLFRAHRPLAAHLVVVPRHCDRCGKATESVTLGLRDCPDRCREPRTA